MDPLIQEFSRRYDALSKPYKAVVVAGLLVFIANQGMTAGQSIGRALYHLTH